MPRQLFGLMANDLTIQLEFPRSKSRFSRLLLCLYQDLCDLSKDCWDAYLKSRLQKENHKALAYLSRIISQIAIVRFFVLNIIQLLRKLSRLGASLGGMGAEVAFLSAMSAHLSAGIGGSLPR